MKLNWKFEKFNQENIIIYSKLKLSSCLKHWHMCILHWAESSYVISLRTMQGLQTSVESGLFVNKIVYMYIM